MMLLALPAKAKSELLLKGEIQNEDISPTPPYIYCNYANVLASHTIIVSSELADIKIFPFKQN